jgi:dipeptidyl aminopeptidase/acylaminoacyl peptidase
MDLATGVREQVFRHHVVDAQLLTDQKQQPWAVRIWAGIPEVIVLDDEHPYGVLNEKLKTIFPNAMFGISGATSDYRYITFYVTKDTLPATYYVYDGTKGTIQKLFESRPWLDSEKLSQVHPISLTARDGVRLHGLMTLPKDESGVERKQNLPAVIMPHGGPFGIYDRWGFNPDAQLLADRGYVVVQINFRGSGGYGPKFESMGIGQWGGKMQDDVTDATRWLIDAGIADEQRICIYGWSHGGYAALRGVQKEPDLYKCATGAAGVYDFNLQYRKADYTASRSGRAYMKQALGDDKDANNKISPAHNAKDIKAAVLLVHGDEDRRVPIAHAKVMRRALKKAGNPAQYMKIPNEGHGLFNESNRIDFYNVLLKFLNEHIGPQRGE